jgi:ABC-type multidrug transport system fused ATPase/permease subunit
MDGAPMSSAPAPQAGGQAEAIAPGPSAVVVDEVSYRFGEHTAVDHVNLAIEPGETFACSARTEWATLPLRYDTLSGVRHY